MTAPHLQLETPRLILRPGRDSDRAPYAAMNADPHLRYDKTKNVWINDAKKLVWTVDKGDENNYKVTCKLGVP